MVTQSPFDRLAEAELARHRPELRYADIQRCKRGDYEVVARELRRRKYVTLRFYGVALVAMISISILLGRPQFMVQALFWGFLLVRMFEEYVHARRTEQFLERLRAERDQLPAAGPSGTKDDESRCP